MTAKKQSCLRKMLHFYSKALTVQLLNLGSGIAGTADSEVLKCSQDGRRQGDSLALCVLIQGTAYPQGGTDGALTSQRL